MRIGPFDKYQATAPPTVPLPPDFHLDQHETAVYWLSAAGILVNCHGTTVMIDPLLSVLSDDPATGETGEPLLTTPPIAPDQVPRLDAVLYTHTDNDHMGPLTAKALMRLGAPFHGTPQVIAELANLGLPPGQGSSHRPGEAFRIGPLEIEMTPAFHPHQILNKDFKHYFGPEDCCGYKIQTPDGCIWIPGDSILMNQHLEMKGVDLMFFDCCENASHFGLGFATGLANVHEQAELIMYHFGTFYGPDNDWANADPEKARPRLRRPERLHVLAPGEKFVLKKG